MLPAEGAVRATNGDAHALLPSAQWTRSAAASASPPETPLATIQSARPRKGFVFAVTMVVLTAALGGVAVLVAALRP
jgi:hypothetical protein